MPRSEEIVVVGKFACPEVPASGLSDRPVAKAVQRPVPDTVHHGCRDSHDRAFVDVLSCLSVLHRLLRHSR